MKLSIIILLLAIFTGAVYADMLVSNAAQNQTEPATAGLSNRSIVAWTDSRSGTTNLNIFGNIVDTDGTLIGADIPLCYATGNQYDVAAAAGAKFVLGWIDERSGDPEVYALQVENDGTLPFSDFALTATTNSKDYTAASNIGNDMMFVWQETGAKKQIRGRCLSWSGTQYSATGSVFNISAATYDAFFADIAGGSSNYLVVWTDADETAGGNVIAQMVSSSGTLVGDTTVLANYAYPYYPQDPAVAWDGSQWLVIWNHYTSDYNVYGRYVNSSGVATGSVFDITITSSNETRPDIAFDGAGFLSCWQATQISLFTDVYGARIIGTTVEIDTQLSTGSNNENYPAICWNGAFYDVFWQDYRSTTTWDIYTNRFGQTPWNGPTATVIRPPDLGATSCPRQEAVMFLDDSDGIDQLTIEFDANGTTVGIGDSRLTYANDTLRFTPSSDWPEDVWLDMCLNHAEDSTGLDILNPICWSFMFDQTDPVWGASSPDDEELVGGGAIPISIEVADAGCGMSTDSMGFQIMGTWYFYGVSTAVSWDGFEMSFDPAEEGLTFDPFDTFDVCAKARDKADYCAYNQIEHCWTFYTQGNRIFGNVDLSDTGDDSGVSVEATVGDSLWSDVTDILGDYSIACVMEVPGIQVRASIAGYSDSAVTIDMSSGGEVEINFTLNPTLNLYESDFEADNGGLDTVRFGTNPNDWRWGTPTDGPGSSHSGSKCWATDLTGDYSNRSMSRLTLGPINIPADSGPILTWWQWYSFQNNSGGGFHDGGNIKVFSSDTTIVVPDRPYDGNQSEWNYLIPYETSYADNDIGDYWHEVSIDLSPWEGEEITISWDFGSSNNNTECGWFIDDVVISTTPSNILSFAIDCTTWSPTSIDPPDTIVSRDEQKIVLTNTGNVALDIAMACDSVPYFILDDTLAYARFGLWSIFDDSPTAPLAEDFDAEDFFSHMFRYADADTFGPGGFDIYPHADSTENLWFRFDSPPTFAIDTFTIRIFLQAREHIE